MCVCALGQGNLSGTADAAKCIIVIYYVPSDRTLLHCNLSQSVQNVIPLVLVKFIIRLSPSVMQSAFASTSDGCSAFPAHASVSTVHTPLITRTRYQPVIISYKPSFSLRSASGAPRQPGESVTTHLTHS